MDETVDAISMAQASDCALDPERIANWALDFLEVHGEVLSQVVHDWHTETTREMTSLRNFRIKTYGTFSMFGGNNVKIWTVADDGKEALVFDVDIYAIGDPKPRNIVELPEWYSRLEPYITSWEEKERRAEEKLRREAAQIQRHRPYAQQVVSGTPWVRGISEAYPKDWAHILEHGKEIGLLPKNEVWKGDSIMITLNTGDKVFVNRRHLDFEKWKSVRLSEKPLLDLRSRPSRNILPAWARYLKLE